MAGTTPLSYEIVPWVRRGLTSLITGAAAQAYASLPVTLSVNGTAVNAPPVRLLGPGDITGIDARAVTRTDPRDANDAFEPNYLASVEFAAPDFPWMFTPSGPANGRLQPWICLIVVPDGPGTTLSAPAGGTSTLRIDAPLSPKDELPDLSTIDSWAHAQVTGSGLSGTALAAAFDGDASLTCARLLASRKLDSNAAYIACVVPTYHAGVAAGLGLAADPTDLSPAWDASVTAPFVLPVYYAFRFRTGPGGDFASLARKIVPDVAGASAGTRSVEFGKPGFGVPDASSIVLGLEGALKTPGGASSAWPAGTQTAFAGALRAALDPPVSGDPVVAPPTYGHAQTGAALPATGQQPVWLEELNLDPRARTAAGAGSQVVQAAREALVGSAWDQAGEIRKANAILARAQLARAVSSSLNRRHLAPVSDGSFLQMTAPVHARVTLTMSGSTGTLRAAVTSSVLPASAVSAALRRLMRPQGRIGRQLPAGPSQIVSRLNAPATTGSTGLRVLPPLGLPRGMVAFDDVATNVTVASMVAVPAREISGWNLATTAATTATTATTSTTAVSAHAVDITAAGPVEAESHPVAASPDPARVDTTQIAPAAIELAKDPNLPAILKATNLNVPALIVLPTNATDLAAFGDRFSVAAKVAGTALAVVIPAPVAPPPLGGTAALTATRALVAARIDPERTIGLRTGARIPLGNGRDPLQPVRTGPTFPQAMYAALAELSPEWMLPGFSAIPNDTATLLAPNDAFVEAYLIGLNEEMARELLWRGFPAAGRTTYFQNFWGGPAPDIPAIASFDPAGHLGDRVAAAEGVDQVILLVRTSLFARYPNAVVAAVQAQWSGSVRTLSSTRTYPVFRGNIGSTVTFFGFDVPDARGSTDPSKNDPGWYFAIEEHVTEPRFGLEPASSATANPTWNDLSWPDVTLNGAFLNPATAPATPSREGVTWSPAAASLAFVLERRPVRVAMHALALLGPAPATSPA